MSNKLYYQPFKACEFEYLNINEFTIEEELIQNFKEVLKDKNESIKFRIAAIFIMPWYLYKIRKFEILRYK